MGSRRDGRSATGNAEPGGIRRMNFLAPSILAGVAFETLLACLYFLFPVGACDGSWIGIAVLYLHAPAFLFTRDVLHVSSYAGQASVIMTGIWVAVFCGLSHLLLHKK